MLKSQQSTVITSSVRQHEIPTAQAPHFLRTNDDLTFQTLATLEGLSGTSGANGTFKTAGFRSAYEPYIPRSLSRSQSSCVLKPLPMKCSIALFTASHIVQTLRAFPIMMLRKETFPPFIHPCSYGSLPEPLASCMSIAQIFSSRTVETSPFVWRTIRAEQKHLFDKVCLYIHAS